MVNSWRTKSRREAAEAGILPLAATTVIKPSPPNVGTREAVADIKQAALVAPPVERPALPVLNVGDLILRPVRFLGGALCEKEVLNVCFGRSEDRKSRTFKARRGWEFAPSEWVATEMSGRGVVCFSEEEPPRGWTHFIVVKVGRGGRTATVRPVVGDLGKLFAKFTELGPLVVVRGMDEALASLKEVKS